MNYSLNEFINDSDEKLSPEAKEIIAVLGAEGTLKDFGEKWREKYGKKSFYLDNKIIKPKQTVDYYLTQAEKYMKYLLWITLLVVISIIIYSFFKKEPTNNNLTPVPVSSREITCTEGRQRIDAVNNIFTCIDGEWIYTGGENNIKG